MNIVSVAPAKHAYFPVKDKHGRSSMAVVLKYTFAVDPRGGVTLVPRGADPDLVDTYNGEDKLAQGALAVVKASVAAGGLGSGPANLYRCVGATEMRSAFGGTTLEHVLFPDATLPNGNALEIKRPSEKESHENQFENYAQASPGGACEVLSCKGCAGDACPKKGDDCPAPKV